MSELVEALRYKLEGRGFDSRFTEFVLPASKRNEYEEVGA